VSGDSRGGSTATKRKVTLYFNSVMLAETQHEAIRQDRSISWIIQAAWRRARGPAGNDAVHEGQIAGHERRREGGVH